MKFTLLAVIAASALSLSLGSHASAQQRAGWAAAAAKCRAQGRAQYPTAQESQGQRSERARAYQACMAGLGYRP
jgi:hypothetical protein